MRQPAGYYLRRVEDGELVVFMFCPPLECPRPGETRELNGMLCVVDLVNFLADVKELYYRGNDYLFDSNPG